MSTHPSRAGHGDARANLRALGEQALLARGGCAAGGRQRLALLLDAAENFPAWLDAIEGARRCIFFEAYILADDAVGRVRRGAASTRPRAACTCALLYDWLGAARRGRADVLAAARAGGVEVRCFNPPRLDSPLGWLRRDHRKMPRRRRLRWASSPASASPTCGRATRRSGHRAVARHRRRGARAGRGRPRARLSRSVGRRRPAACPTRSCPAADHRAGGETSRCA